MAYNTGKVWNTTEITKLRKAVTTFRQKVKAGKLSAKQPIKLIAKQLKRSVSGIRSKAYEKNISLNFTGLGGGKTFGGKKSYGYSRKAKRRH